MRDTNKRLRPWLESWGAWRRLRLNIDYPIEAISCNPDLHTALPITEPSFRMPKYDDRLTPEANAKRIIKWERALREYYHVKRTETKPKRTSRSPDYDPHWRMNAIDREVTALPDKLQEVIRLRYEREYLVKEIPAIIKRSAIAVHKRFEQAHNALQHVPYIVQNEDTYSLHLEYYKNKGVA